MALNSNSPEKPRSSFVEHHEPKTPSIDWGLYGTVIRQWWPIIAPAVIGVAAFVFAHLQAIGRVSALEERQAEMIRQSAADHDILIELRTTMLSVKDSITRIDKKLP